MLGYPAVALLDRDGVSGAPRFHKAALAAGIRPLIGAELTLEAGPQAFKPSSPQALRPSSPHRTSFSLPVLCASQEGWRNLCRLISRMKLRASAPGSPPRTPARWGGKGEGALTIDDLDGCVTGLIAMPGRPLLRAERFGVGGLLDRIVGIFGRAN